ncbi:MAG: haloacid dehalogenase-like hydrolase [Alphaproteobacteria bacterium]|nr:MAG: haloacid dehalogenase-like hydrolase [Alphaproteobacteria bacterium]
MSGLSGIAVFDFDGTLCHGDSLADFLIELAGPARFAMAAAIEGGKTAWGMVGSQNRIGAERRSLFKAGLLRRLLADMPLETAKAAAARLPGRIRWREDVVEILRQHKARGHHILVASGGLDLYLPPLLEPLGVDAILATPMEVDDQGRLTGAMLGGLKTNCVRVEKARRVSDYLAAQAPYGDSWGYGNLPHDYPMLSLLHHRLVIA